MIFIGPGPKDRSKIKVYLKSSTKVKNTVLNYPFLSMVAELGGYTGLLLGVSLVNITSLLDKTAEYFRHKQ